jgi:hypothetical protein
VGKGMGRTISEEGGGGFVDGEGELEEEREGHGDEAEEDGPGPELDGQGRGLDELAAELHDHHLQRHGDDHDGEEDGVVRQAPEDVEVVEQLAGVEPVCVCVCVCGWVGGWVRVWGVGGTI